jgi:aryl sulfotransferase
MLRLTYPLLLVHYNDLKADLDPEMRRVATFLNIDIPIALWPEVVERCTFDRMRARADKVGNFDRAFEGGAQSFLFRGTNGRWRSVLSDGELQRYRQRVEELLPPEAARWLEHGER